MVIFLTALDKLLFILEIFILIRVVISWLPIDRNSQIVGFIHTVTEPILSPIRKMIDKSIFGGRGQVLDFSPFIAYIILQLLQNLIPY